MERVVEYILFFFFYSIIGWISEVIYCYIKDKKFTNRGFLFGPLCPIYGTGAVSMLLTLTWCKDIWFGKFYAGPLMVLLIGVVVCDVVEYLTSFLMEKLFRGNKHVLKEKEEKLLSYYSPVLHEGSELYSKLAVADGKVKTVKLSNGEKVAVTQGNWRALIADVPTAADRKKVFEAIFTAYEENKNTYAEIYNLVMKSEKASVQARNYASILESHLFGNNIPTSVFTNLVDVASKHNKSVKKYYKLRKKYLGLKTHYSYDRFLQLAHSDKKYSYEEGKELFFKSIENTPADFQAKAREVLRDGFVDVYEQDGKRSGAYSSSVSDSHPFILLNYTDTLDDVFTLAHEAGHSMHSLYSQEAQPAKLQHYTIFVAEIASTFNEHMLLDYLIKSGNTTKSEKIMLLQKAIDEILSTFYRQTLFANYEYNVSKMIEENKPIVAIRIDGLGYACVSVEKINLEAI